MSEFEARLPVTHVQVAPVDHTEQKAWDLLMVTIERANSIPITQWKEENVRELIDTCWQVARQFEERGNTGVPELPELPRLLKSN